MANYHIGKKLKEYRKKLGLSQSELARKLNVTNKAISKWENDNAYPSTELLANISKIFNTTIDNILKEDKNKKNITKIVITGGPCAGKTTALSWIQNKYTKEGYDVIFIPEAATEIINAGINPRSIKENINFQKIILNLQTAKEKVYEKATKYLTNDKILIVYDRGTMDGKAYITKQEFKQLLLSTNNNEVELRDNYDAVFHLVTAANGAEKFYTLENNQARYETVEEARNIDKKLIESWTGHPHLRIIDNKTNFNDKMKKLITEISHFLGESEAYEIEQKYLIEYPNLKKLEQDKKAIKVEIIQTYLKNNDKNIDENRIRQRGIDGNYIYSQTTKKKIDEQTRIEVEKRLTKNEYLDLLMEADTNLTSIRKTRYCLVYQNQYLEIDIYPFWNDKAILEVELNNKGQEVALPKYIKVIEDVTNNKEYKNHQLAKTIGKRTK